MSKSLWSEGRVVGLSAYELYARYVLANNDTPSDEKSWLASTLSYGSSMLLWVEPDNSVGPHYRDFEFPTTSNLGACNTIVAAFFSGSGVVDSGSPWAVKVESYGPLIENDSVASPDGIVTDISSGVPVKNNGALDQLTTDQIQDFAKITDAVVVQPGTWSANSSGSGPAKKLNPDLTKAPTLRIAFANRVTNGFWLLLTGFIDRNISLGMTKQGDATAPTAPQNGDFLGPAIFPWATKVVISIPPAMMAYMRSVSISTQDIAAIQLYNTRYIWLYCTHPDSSAPTQDDLKDAKQIYQLIGVTGYVSSQFITDFCVDLATMQKACRQGHISDVASNPAQDAFARQLITRYGGDAAAEAAVAAKYKFFFWTEWPAVNAPGSQGMFFPIDLETNSFAFTVTEDRYRMNVPHGINFTTSEITVDSNPEPPTSVDLLGALYDASADYTVQTGDFYDADHTLVYSNHPTLWTAIKEFSLFTRATVPVPKAPATYDNNFTEWFKSMRVAEALGLGNADPAQSGQAILTAMGVHSDYSNLDFQSFLQYAATGRDLSQAIDSEATSVTRRYDHYMYSAATITAISQDDFSWDDGANYQDCAAKFSAATSSAAFYKPCNVQILARDPSSTHTSFVPGADLTETYTSTAYRRWAAVTENDDTSITALSLVDGFGSYLSTVGVSGTIHADVLRWSDLLDGLNLDKAIDLLGGLINMKNSGTNYIQLGTLRLYVSSTEPTGTIPEGSIGIGWGGVKVYTSGAWVAST